MFRKKRKLPNFRFAYGKSPSYSKQLPQKRYSQKLLKKTNPIFSKAKKAIYLMTVILLTIISIYGIFFSNILLVKNIEIIGETFENETLNQEIKNALRDSYNKNLLFVDEEDLKITILQSFPEIEDVKVDKNYPETIVIEFTKYPLVTNIISESKNIRKSFIINSIGYAIKENLENPNLPYILIKSEEPVNTETPVIESTKLKYILDAKTYFEEKFGMKIKEIEYKNIAREVHLLTERDFYIWLDIQRPFEEQFKKLKKALVKLDIFTENLQYIDLRIAGESGDKIIYKRR